MASEAREPEESLRSGAGFALLAQVAGALLTAGLTLYLVRALEPESFGDFSLALGIVGLLGVPADLGLSMAAERLIAGASDNPGERRSVFRSSLLQKLAIAGIVSGGLIAAAGPIAELFDSEDLAPVLRASSLILFGQAIFLLPDSVFIAVSRNRARLVNILQKSGIEVAATVALVSAGLGATGAALGRGLGFSVAALLGLLVSAAILRGGQATSVRQDGGDRGDEAAAGEESLHSFALPMFLFAVAWAAFVEVDVIIVGLLEDSTQVGLFQAAVRLTTFLGFLGLAVATALGPRYATERGRREGPQALEDALRGLLLVQLAGLAAIVVWATPLLDLVLGAEYADSADVLRLLAPYIVMMAVAPLITVVVHYGADLWTIRNRIPVTLAAIAVNVVLDVILVSEIGITGAAIGSSVAFVVYLAPHVRVMLQLVPGVDAGRIYLAAVRGLLAASVATLPLLALGTGEHSLPVLALGLAASFAIYTGALLAGGELERGEIGRGRAWLAGRIGS